MHLVGSVLFGADDAVRQYVQERTRSAVFGPCIGLGITRKEKLIGGVVFYEQSKFDVRAGYALEPGHFYPWRAIFSFPFNDLGVARITSIIAKKHKKARRLAEALGFKMEGVHPLAFDGVETSISYGMTRANCRWIKD